MAAFCVHFERAKRRMIAASGSGRPRGGHALLESAGLVFRTRFVTRILLSAALALLFAGPVFADSFSSLEERMSAKDFKAAGLDKLTPEELQQLNEWLRLRGAGGQAGAPVAVVEDKRGFMLDRDRDTSAIVSRIAGEFRGWDGTKTVVTLQNGQVWQSNDSGARMAVKLDSPGVTIESGMMNSWYMQIEGYNKKVRVKRIK